MCQGLVERELWHTKGWQTVAQRLFAAQKLSGARGAAESGFRLVVGVLCRCIGSALWRDM